MDENMMEALKALMLAAMQARKEDSDSDDPTPSDVRNLHRAAATGDLRRCQSLVRQGVDPNVGNKKGYTALHLAAGKNEVAVAKELLRAGADVNAVDEDGDTPLIFAAMKRHEEMVELLLNKGAKVDLCNHKAQTAADVALNKQCLAVVYQLEGYSHCLQFDCDLHADTLTSAAQEGNLEIVEFWLNHHPNRKVCDHRIGDDRTLAFIAALNGHLGIMQLLDSVGADFEIADNRCHTPLFCAAQNGHVEVAQFLVANKGCNVNHRNVNDRTPIFSATVNGHKEIVELLLKHRADVNAEDEEKVTPLELAIREEFVPIFELLLQHGARLDHVNAKGFDYVIAAAHADKLQMLKELHRRGVSVTQVNKQSGSTALLAACQVGNEEMTRFLLQQGSDGSHQNKHGVSPALRAAFNRHVGVLRVLGDAGAQLDLPNRTGETAALCAAQQDSLEMVRYLHEKGCSMATKDNEGKTLAWYAAKKGNAEMLRFLRDVGAPLDEADGEGNTPLLLAVKEKAGAGSVQLLVAAGCSVDSRNRRDETPMSLALRFGHRDVLTALGAEQPPEPAPPRRRQEAASLPPELEAASQHPRLDASFRSWDIIYDDEKKSPIGAGGFGKVYKAYTDKHQFVAVKIVKAKGLDRRRLDRAIESEKKGIEILRQVQHPNIMCFLRCEQNRAGHFCIFTELIAGISLSDLMRKQKKPFDEGGIQKFSLQICYALNYLHSRKPVILHRDIKSSNIMLTHEGIIKLIDFGLAKEVVTSSEVYTSANACGTLCFMAPELLSAENEEHVAYSPKSDVWAFGCTVYEMSTSFPPNCRLSQMQMCRAIRFDPMPTLPDRMSQNLHDFYARCVLKDPGTRPDTGDLLQHPFLADE